MEVTFPKLGLEMTIDRVALSVFGFDIYWYAVLILTGFLLAVGYCLRCAKRFDIKPDPFIDIVMVGLACGIIGARAYYVLFRLDSYDSFFDMINLRDGGLAIYGGVIAAFVSGIIMCRYVEKVEILPVFDVVSIGFLIGQCIGRWGNFMNQEAFGRETNLPWGMMSANTYYYEVVDGVSRRVGPTTVHPCFLYESLWCLAGFLLLHFISQRYYRFKGQMFLCYLFWYGLGRAWIEGLRTDSLWLVDNVIKVSQLLAILCVLVSAALLYVGWQGIAIRGWRFPSKEPVMAEAPAQAD
ncbi:MAG: prolipoprotein diacylglyceryl transferase [Clostridia bacterium]|nr:prolipoprotein diacylglyceryl transferase [Clostridia bacterium]